MRYYDRALRICPSADESETDINKRHAIIHFNKAAVFLELNRFYEAYKEAKIVIEAGGGEIGEEKALYRLRFKIFHLHFFSYGLREWDSACEHFRELIQKFPSNL